MFISYPVFGRCWKVSHPNQMSGRGGTFIKARSRLISSSDIRVTLGAAGMPKYFFISSNTIIS